MLQAGTDAEHWNWQQDELGTEPEGTRSNELGAGDPHFRALESWQRCGFSCGSRAVPSAGPSSALPMPYESWDIKIPVSSASPQPATHPLDISVLYSRTEVPMQDTSPLMPSR